MSRPGAPLLGYALLIGIAAAVLWVWSPDRLPAALLAGAAVLAALIGGAAAARRREDRAPAALRPIPDLSFSVVAIAFGLCTAVVGAYLGLYLVLIGAGVLVLGLGGLSRELRAERRAVRRARESGDAG